MRKKNGLGSWQINPHGFRFNASVVLTSLGDDGRSKRTACYVRSARGSKGEKGSEKLERVILCLLPPARAGRVLQPERTCTELLKPSFQRGSAIPSQKSSAHLPSHYFGLCFVHRTESETHCARCHSSGERAHRQERTLFRCVYWKMMLFVPGTKCSSICRTVVRL